MKINNYLAFVAILIVGALPVHFANALEVSHIPLYAGGGAKPNVLFIIDDSGSMQSAVMKTRAATTTSRMNGLDMIAFLVAPFSASDDFDFVLTGLNNGSTFFRGFSTDEALDVAGGVNIDLPGANPDTNAHWGSGFADFPGSGGELNWIFNSQPIGPTSLNIRYSNGSGFNRYLSVEVDGVQVSIVTFPPTGGWGTWKILGVPIQVNNAAVKLTLRGRPTSPGPNIDSIYLNSREMDAGLAFASLCSGVNLLAFDPNKTYLPWSGQPNSNYPLAQKIPFQPNKGTTDLTNARYVIWQDDGDGVYEFGECGAYMNGTHVAFNMSRLTRVSTLTAQQKQNFANWYTYHRTREYAVKAGLSPVLADLRVRAGLSTIHIHTQPGVNWGMNITDVDNFTNPALQANKDELLNEFYDILSINPNNFGGTPLRRTLENAGLYFHLDNPSAVDTPETGFLPDLSRAPFLPAIEGGACQANHMILVTDGFQFEYNGQGPRKPWGNVDGNIGGLYGDNLSNTLADIAMYFATTDAAPNITGDQFVNTHTLGFGVFGQLTGYPTTAAEKNWPATAAKLVGSPAFPFEYPDSLDDVMHAAFNGGGRYMTATDAESLGTQMKDLMRDLSNTYRGTATAISFDEPGLAASTTMFRTLYDMNNWQGQLNAYNFDASTATVGTEKWEASARLDLKGPNNKRKIVTFNGVKGAPFVAPSNPANPSLLAGELNSIQLSDLLADKPMTANSADYLQDMIEFLRQDGDGYDTNPQFRARSSLGDIVHSSPVYVGAPSGFYPNGFEAASYTSYVSAKSTRTPMLYAGANDGMLHAFNANTGDEVFAYIPQGVYSSGSNVGLHWLANPGYFHLPYVDETPVAADVYIGGQWRTYLAGGLGRGGKSVYVLDVTDPTSIASEAGIASDVVVTEFSDANMGYSFGTPHIAKLNDGEWVAIFGNGYNNNTDGKAYLYVLYLDGAGPGGVNHVKIGPLGNYGSVTGGYCENAASDCNGLSVPTLVDLNSDGKLDRVYAGDLFGNVWAFDFTKNSNGAVISSASPSSVVPVVDHENNSAAKMPLFTACRGALSAGVCAKANRQPITTKVAVADHPAHSDVVGEAPNLMVYFGTGQYLAEADILDLDIQTFYGVWDSGVTAGGLQPAQLTAQALAADANGNRTMSSVNAVSYIRAEDDLSGNGNYGWKMPLTSGEKVIENPTVVNDVVLFSTRITSNNLCSRSGSGFIMGLDLATGGKPAFQIFPDQDADIGIAELSGGEIIHAQGAPLKWFAPDPDNDATPASFTIKTEPKRAPRRSSWTIMK